MQKKTRIFILLLIIVTIKVIISIPIKEDRFQINTINPNRQEYIKSAVMMDIPINIDGNDALDTFCSADGTNGSSWSTAHVIENCVIDALKNCSCIKIKNTDRYLIIKNCIVINSKIGYAPIDAGIFLINCINVNITNCEANNNFYGIYLFNSKNITLWGNNVLFNNPNGIYLQNSKNITLWGNNVLFNNRNGIYLKNSSNNIFLNNAVSNNSYAGISLYKANNNIFSDNIVSNNKFRGISLKSSDNNTISINNASYNGKYYYCNSIELSDSDYNEVCWNSFYYNTKKPIFDAGKDNYIHDNDFISESDTEPFPLLLVAIGFFITFLIILIIIIIVILRSHYYIDRRKKIGLGVLSGLFVFGLIFTFPLYNYMLYYPFNENQVQILGELSQVCERKGINNATAYTNASGIHPVVLLDPLGKIIQNWTKDIPEEWWPKSINDAELVIRVGDEGERVIETCQYIMHSISRVQLFLNVQLLEVKTGEIIASTTLYGSEPRHFGISESSDLYYIKGSSVSFEQIKEWVEPYIMPGV